MPAASQASVRTRTQRSSPGLRTTSTSASPRAPRSCDTICSRRPSLASAGVSSATVPVSLNGTTTHDDRLAGRTIAGADERLGPLAAPAGAHVLVLDALLQQHDALEQGF